MHLYFHTGSHTCTTKPYIPDGFDEFILRNDRRKGPVQLQKDYLFEVSSKSFDYAKVVEEAKKVVDTERIKNKQRKNNKSSYPFGKGFEALGKYVYTISINEIYQDARGGAWRRLAIQKSITFQKMHGDPVGMPPAFPTENFDSFHCPYRNKYTSRYKYKHKYFNV